VKSSSSNSISSSSNNSSSSIDIRISILLLLSELVEWTMLAIVAFGVAAIVMKEWTGNVGWTRRTLVHYQ